MIPERVKSVCEFCGQDVDMRASGVHQFTSGWVRQREGGGGHGISLAVRSPRWAHSWCIEREVKGFGKQGVIHGL